MSKNRLDKLDGKTCIHGGPRKKCKGQCKFLVKIEDTNTFYRCLLDKGHKKIHEIAKPISSDF